WRLALRWPVTGPGRGRGIVRHAVAALVISVLVVAAYVAINTGLPDVPAPQPWFRELPRSVRENALFLFTSYFHVALLVYTGILACANASASRAALQARQRAGVAGGAPGARARRPAPHLGAGDGAAAGAAVAAAAPVPLQRAARDRV